MDFSRRSYEAELLDGDSIPFREIEKNMEELEIINKRLGGHRVSLKGFEALATAGRPLTVCEIGCGGGDNLMAIARKSRRSPGSIQMIGIDRNPDCIAIAKMKLPSASTRFIVSDYRLVDWQDEKPDIIFASLFCHHFNDEELPEVLRWMSRNARIGFFVNDLHRSPLAYYSIKMLTSVFSRSRLVKNDAPLSVLRGFRRQDWKDLLHKAGMRSFTIRWMWAFRWLVTVKQTA